MPAQTDRPPVIARGDPDRFTAAGLCTVATRVTPAGAIVQLSGQLCYASSPAVRERLVAIMARGPIRRLDLSGLTFVDLAGIDTLAYVLDRIGHPLTPEVRLGVRARRLLDLLTRLGDAADAHAGAAGDRSDGASLRAVGARGRRPGRGMAAPAS